MKHSIEQLLKEIAEGKKHEYLFFWKNTPSEDGTIIKTCLSQWWHEGFVVEGKTYATAEHWMMAEKARLFKDEEMEKAILADDSPAAAQKFGRQVKGFDKEIWIQNRFEIVKQGSIHKFSYNEALKTFLLNTQETVLVEASPQDKIWGIGMDEQHENATNPEKWEGLNLLGFALMEAREELLSKG